MNNRRVRAELIQIIGHTIVKARANGKDDIRMVHRRIGLKGTVHAQHTQILSIGARVDSPDPSGYWSPDNSTPVPEQSAALRHCR